jgi:thiamine biosynthesis lipoprotein
MVQVAIPFDLPPEGMRPPTGRLVRLTGPTMGLSWTVSAVTPPEIGDHMIRQATQAAVDQVVAEMSQWEARSALSKFNHAAGGWVVVPDGLFSVTAAAVRIAAASGGAFDPTLGALVDLWGFGPPGAPASSPDRETLARASTGWRRLELDPPTRRIRQLGGLRLDLSGIAKGYGVDRVGAALDALGLLSWLVEIGGELRGRGVKPNGEPWFVDIERAPGSDQAEPLRIALYGLAVASSGDWRRVLQHDGRAISHTIDPVTRAPVDNGLRGATVLHAECMYADAWCTVMMTLGLERGLELADREGLAVLFQPSGGAPQRCSAALQAMLD